MTAPRDLLGQRFGRLVVIARDGSTKEGQARWLCQCDCGNTTTVTGNHLITGNTRSCGCLQADVAASMCRTHGLGDHPLYSTWADMHERCENPNHPSYKDYGGRGIKVCARWSPVEPFITDIESTIGARPPDPPDWRSNRPYWTLDRIDNHGNYEPGNVRWATPSEQIANRRKP
jgi:hypothetical protein